MIGQGIVLMVAGMGIVYAFLYLLIAVSELASRFVPRFDFMVAGGEQKKQTKKLKSQPLAHTSAPIGAEATHVTAPVPGTVLRISVSDGQNVAKDEAIAKMVDAIAAERPGRFTSRLVVAGCSRV